MAAIYEQISMKGYVDEQVELINKNTISVLNNSNEDTETIGVYVTEGGGEGITLRKGQSVTLTASAGNVLPPITIVPLLGTGIFELITQ